MHFSFDIQCQQVLEEDKTAFGFFTAVQRAFNNVSWAQSQESTAKAVIVQNNTSLIINGINKHGFHYQLNWQVSV